MQCGTAYEKVNKKKRTKHGKGIKSWRKGAFTSLFSSSTLPTSTRYQCWDCKFGGYERHYCYNSSGELEDGQLSLSSSHNQHTDVIFQGEQRRVLGEKGVGQRHARSIQAQQESATCQPADSPNMYAGTIT